MIICPKCREPIPYLAYHASECTGPAPDGNQDLVATYGRSTKGTTSSTRGVMAPA